MLCKKTYLTPVTVFDLRKLCKNYAKNSFLVD